MNPLNAVPTRTLDCNGCTACCKGEAVFLHPGDVAETFLTDIAQHPLTGRMGQCLKHKENGDCVYLGEAGCTIYDRRPVVCRGFSCVGLVEKVLALPRAERRRLIRDGRTVDSDVWQEGQKRLEAAKASGQ